MKQKIINLAGGPGSGKSTTAAGTFNLLKSAGISCELVGEFAKDLTYEGAFKTLSNQLLVFAEQEHRLRRLRGQVEWIVTDSPLYLSLAYRDKQEFGDWFEQTVSACYEQYDNYDIFIRRTKPYQTYGRSQDEGEARALASSIRLITEWFASPIQHWTFDGDYMAPVRIAQALFGEDVITKLAIERNWRIAA